MALEKRQGAPQLSGAWDWNWERVTVFGCGRAGFAVTEYPGQTVTPCWERSAHPAHDNPSVLKAVPAEQPAAELIFLQALLSPLSQALQPQHVLGVCCGVVGTDLNPHPASLCPQWEWCARQACPSEPSEPLPSLS